MSAESGIAGPVLTQCHENSGVGKSSHSDRDLLDRFGRLLRVNRPCLGDGRKKRIGRLDPSVAWQASPGHIVRSDGPKASAD